jgi:hypothetical protein
VSKISYPGEKNMKYHQHGFGGLQLLMVVVPRHDNHDIVVKVYLKDGVVENKTGQEQFIYITGDKPSGSGSSYMEWGCGASGVGAELLPDNCKA